MTAINILIPRAQLQSMSRRDRKKLETRWRIYDAAMELVAKLGYDEMKIEDICDTADVSSGAFFQHFSNKAALIGAYLDLLKARIGSKLDEASNATSLDKLNIINNEIARSSESTTSFTPQLFSAISAERKLGLDHLDTGLTGTLTRIIKEGQDNGEFSQEWHPELVAVSLTASWILMPLAMNAPDVPSQPHDELLKLMLTGLT